MKGCYEVSHWLLPRPTGTVLYHKLEISTEKLQASLRGWGVGVGSEQGIAMKAFLLKQGLLMKNTELSLPPWAKKRGLDGLTSLPPAPHTQ